MSGYYNFVEVIKLYKHFALYSPFSLNWWLIVVIILFYFIQIIKLFMEK